MQQLQFLAENWEIPLIADYVYSMDKGWNDMQYSAIIGFIGQLLGYYIADSKNLDADSPRHLTQAIVLK